MSYGTQANKLRRAPETRCVNEERPAGLFYLGSLSKGKSLVAERAWTIQRSWIASFVNGELEERWVVKIAYGLVLNSEADVAEWGVGKTEEEAWRYALGAATGSYEDEVIYDPDKALTKKD